MLSQTRTSCPSVLINNCKIVHHLYSPSSTSTSLSYSVPTPLTPPPCLCFFFFLPQLNLHHSSDKASSLACWATTELSRCHVLYPLSLSSPDSQSPPQPPSMAEEAREMCQKVAVGECYTLPFQKNSVERILVSWWIRMVPGTLQLLRKHVEFYFSMSSLLKQTLSLFGLWIFRSQFSQ